MDKQTSNLVYKQTIMPCFYHIVLLVESSIRKKMCKLQPLQNRAVKIISCRNYYVSTAEMKVLRDNLGLSLLAVRS